MSHDSVLKTLTHLYRYTWKQAQVLHLSRRRSREAFERDPLYTRAVSECAFISDGLTAYRKGTIPTVQRLLIRRRRFFVTEARELERALEDHTREALGHSFADTDEYLKARLQSQLLHEELSEVHSMINLIETAMLELKRQQDEKRGRSQ